MQASPNSTDPHLGLDPEATTVPLVFDAPLQSWGHQDLFTRRNTLPFPTQSAVVGMIAAAMHLARGSVDEGDRLPDLNAVRMMACRLGQKGNRRSVTLLTDYHTVMGARTASGKTKPTELTNRDYLLDSKFIVLLQGTDSVLVEIVRALRSPAWGVWFGRRCCVPAIPILPPGELPCPDALSAWNQVRNVYSEFVASDIPASWEGCERMVTATDFDSADETLQDVPLSFGFSQKSYGTRRARRYSPKSKVSVEETVESPLDFLPDSSE